LRKRSRRGADYTFSDRIKQQMTYCPARLEPPGPSRLSARSGEGARSRQTL